MRMQQKQVTKKAAVARKVKGRRGVTILCLAGFSEMFLNIESKGGDHQSILCPAQISGRLI